LASLAGINAQIGYKHRPVRYGDKPAVVAENTVARNFDVAAPDQVWVTVHSDQDRQFTSHEGHSFLKSAQSGSLHEPASSNGGRN
jgi:putative transposase